MKKQNTFWNRMVSDLRTWFAAYAVLVGRDELI
jgi:hypothetical protein